MKYVKMTGLVLVGVAGAAMAGEEPTVVEASVGNLKHVAHMYYNIGTGERITTLIQGGDTTTYFYKLDDPGDPSTLHRFFYDWGDIPMDTVVDCVQIHWATNHQDVDLVDVNGDPNPDGQADGIVGFKGSWAFMDADNGRAPACDCLCLPGDPESEYVPAAHFQVVLYGPGDGILCFADLNGDGGLDFFDISFFLNNMVYYNEDTVFDFFDVSAFLADFGAGCP